MISSQLLSIEKVLDTYKSRYHGLKALRPYFHWFPIKSSIPLSGIIADLMGDGHLQGNPRWRIDYTSKHTEELNRFNDQIFLLFGLVGKIRPCFTNKYGTKNLGINNCPLARTLNSLGVPSGSKVLKKFSIPSWILKDKNYFAKFVNRLFSCEGSVDLKYKFIAIQMNKSESLLDDGLAFFLELKNFLKIHFGIITTNPFLERRTNLRKDGIKTKGIILKIKRRDSLKKFRDHIGFEDKAKMTRLNQILP